MCEESVVERGSESRLRQPIRWRAVALACLGVGVLVGLRLLALDAFTVPTPSMEPSLQVGDFVLVERLAYGLDVARFGTRLPGYRQPRRGEVVVFRPPHSPRLSYVKRLVALPGDTIQMGGGVLYVNGQAQWEPYARTDEHQAAGRYPSMDWQRAHLAPGTHPDTYQPDASNWGPLIVPEAQLFVLGDNRPRSEDSRSWGFIPQQALSGRPILVYFSVHAEPTDTHWLRRIRWNRVGRRIP